ncbi:putative reverse transcriptase domain-containing protein [Tanacetum coccineum]
MFHITTTPEKSQVKYATCTLLGSALTWWNSHKRTIRTEAAFSMSWGELMKLMTKVYCPRNEIQKMETEIWNLTVKNNEFCLHYLEIQELTWECDNCCRHSTRILDYPFKSPNKIDDKKLKGYAMKNAENKRRLNNNYGNNRGQQPPFKQHNTGGQNVARAYMAGNNEKKEYEGTLPFCNKCKLHHKDYPKIKNQNHGDKARVPDTRGKAYVLGGGDANPGPNTVTDTFLLNDHHAYMLFDSGADKKVSTSETNIVLRGCTIGLLGHPFNINLMPVDLGSFDVIIGMDWLAKNHAVIVCDEKIGLGITQDPQKFINFLVMPATDLTIIEVFPQKIAKPMTKLTQKSVTFNWGEKEETTLQTLKQKLCSALILALPEGSENFVVYCDASHKGLGAVLMHKEKVKAYANHAN